MTVPTAPRPDELELTVFGPGLGESVLVHVGNRKWIVVDSCVNCESGQPEALEYFRSIGVNVATDVTLVVATHWHDDHIKGLGKVFKACKSAEFVCSAALGTTDFLTLIEAYGVTPQIVRKFSGLGEFSEIILEIQSRASSGVRLPSPKFASENSCIWQDAQTDWKVISLSPSSSSILQSKLDIHQYVTTLVGAKQSLLPKLHNHFSVVLWVTNGGISLLLGADLEETTDTSKGWSAILGSTARPKGKATAFKIPHHGSSTGHNASVWHQLLESSPLSVVTPWVRGGRHLPVKQDLQRIMGFTTDCFATAPPSSRKPLRKRSEIEKRMRKSVKFIREVNYLGGRVRARTRITAPVLPWSVDLSGSALTIKQLERQL